MHGSGAWVVQGIGEWMGFVGLVGLDLKNLHKPTLHLSCYHITVHSGIKYDQGLSHSTRRQFPTLRSHKGLKAEDKMV